MSNNKPTAVATIRFYPNKHIEVELDSIAGITPRTLAIAENLLSREYRSMKGEYIVKMHVKARKDKADLAAAEKKADEEYHKKRDEELEEANKASLEANAGGPESVVEPVVEPPVAEETAKVETAESQPVEETPVVDETEGSETVTDDESK